MSTAAGDMATAWVPDEAAIAAAIIRRIPTGPPLRLAGLRRFPADREGTDKPEGTEKPARRTSGGALRRG
jgi:hypothetical protein